MAPDSADNRAQPGQLGRDSGLIDPRWPVTYEQAMDRRLTTVEVDVRKLLDWQIEMRTAFRLLQLTFGTSVIAAVGALLSLLQSTR